MKYEFKLFEEALWAGGIAVLLYVLTVGAGWQNPDDWSAFIISAVGGGIRAFAGAALAKFASRGA